jgi:exopolysaccharide biosynthesis polyprenyl glycosylphosphotransferase
MNQAPAKKKQPRFSLQFAERKLLLAVVDLAILNGALFFMLWLRPEPVFMRLLERFPWYVLLLSAIWLVVATLFNIYDLAKAASAVHSIWATAATALVTLTAYLLIPFLTPTLPARRTQIVVFYLAALAGLAIWRFLYASVFTQPTFRHRALVVGAGWSGRTLVEAIHETESETGNPYLGTGYELLGFVDDDPAKLDTAVDGVPVLGTGRDLVQLAEKLQPDEIIIAITHSQRINTDLFQALLTCYEMGIPLTTMATIYEKMTGRVPVQHAGRDLTVLLPLTRPSGFRFYLAFRRAVDILVAVPGLLLVAILIPIVWLGNRLTDPGDVFYRQARVGQGGEVFDMVKFRSMVMDAEAQTGPVWAQEDDPRITPMGRFLRKTRLDEFPRFWNVLKGEMTLIGPRPERPAMVETLSREIPYFRLRHAVKPGITGWAQVRYRYGASREDAFHKLQYDLYYIKHLGPFIDFSVTVRTIQVVLGMKGR